MNSTVKEHVNGVWEVKCPQCGTWIQGERSTRDFCNGTCRQRFNRAKKKRSQDIENAAKALSLVINNMPWGGDSPEYEALQKMETLIKNALGNVTR